MRYERGGERWRDCLILLGYNLTLQPPSLSWVEDTIRDIDRAAMV